MAKSKKPTLAEDKKKAENILNGVENFDAATFKRLILTELSYKNLITENTFCGFSKKEIRSMAERPERYGKSILKLSYYMYHRSGYYRRLIKYFTTMAKYRWTVDMEIDTRSGGTVDNSTIQLSLYRYISAINSYKLEYELERILLELFLNDVCYGYIVDAGTKKFIYYLRPEICEISGLVNGVYRYSISTSISKRKLASLPPSLAHIIQQAKVDKKAKIEVPIENSFCLKYNEHFLHTFPPLVHLISDILDIDDYKSLYMAKTEQDCYRMIVLKIPTVDGKIAMSDEIAVPFVDVAKSTVPESIGVIPTPMDLSAVQFKSDQAERDKVDDATGQFYSEAGVSQALMAGATTGSELEISIQADAGDIYRIYRQIERIMNLQMEIYNLASHNNYSFNFSMLDVTIFNEDKFIDRELKLAQVSVPNKLRLAATIGLNPCKVVGNAILENDILKLADTWKVLKSTATQSAESQKNTGREEKEVSELSPEGEKTRENDTNNPDNRI